MPNEKVDYWRISLQKLTQVGDFNKRESALIVKSNEKSAKADQFMENTVWEYADYKKRETRGICEVQTVSEREAVNSLSNAVLERTTG